MILPALSVLLLSACSNSPPANSVDARSGFDYPVSRQADQVDEYTSASAGTVRVADPYRWLEELDSTETRGWIEAQNKVTDAYLAQIDGREEINSKLSTLWNYERFGLPQKKAGRYFYTRNDGLQNQAVLYVADNLEATPRVLLDPNQLAADGTIALTGAELSEDGRYLAYGTSSGGSDWQEWFVREVDSGKDTGDHLRWVKFSGASWARDGSGFYYARYDAPEGEDPLKAVNENQKVYFHRLGTDQAQDALVYARPDQPKWGFGTEVSDDGDFLIFSVWQGTDERNRLFYQRLDRDQGKTIELINDLIASFSFIHNQGDTFYFLTDHQAPRSRVIAIDLANPAQESWREVVPQAEATLTRVSAVGGRLVLHYLKDAHSQVVVAGLDGQIEREIALPGLGTAGGLNGGYKDSETFYSYTSFTEPHAIYRLDVETGVSTAFRRPKTGFDGSRYETRQVFYPSKDGTRIPMFITARKGIQINGMQPTLLYGYGGFNIPLTPSYSVPVAVWLEMGGVYALANLRGGGEYGKAWHEAGMKLNRQNAFDDFASAAEYLIAEGWTQPDRLAIHGRSNGGLLAATVAQQRPELFAAAVPGVGVLDMLRFNKFTIGWAWESDYGSPQDPTEFDAIYAYSPLHNVRPGVDYPATLITTGDHDDRVFPAHSFKYAAALQAAYSGDEPMLIRIDTRGGHGAGKPTSMQIEEWTDILGFLKRELDF
jgi:prolyl oligopeptidase